jgi:hypothetical protein
MQAAESTPNKEKVRWGNTFFFNFCKMAYNHTLRRQWRPLPTPIWSGCKMDAGFLYTHQQTVSSSSWDKGTTCSLVKASDSKKKSKRKWKWKEVIPKGKSKWFQQGRARGSNREEQVTPTGKSKWFQQGRASDSNRVKQVVPSGKNKWFQQGRASDSNREEQVAPTGWPECL